METKDYNVMIHGRNFFYQPIKNHLKTYHAIRKIIRYHIILLGRTSRGNDNRCLCLLDYPYFQKYHELIAIDLTKQQKLNAGPKAIQ